MRRIYQIVLICMMSGPLCLSGQTADTIRLDEVTVTGDRLDLLCGSKTVHFDSVVTAAVSGGSLADAIGKYLPVYIKQDAGGLSSIRFRGTSPNHTAILYEGMNINSLTLGQSNLSSIPMFLFDDVTVAFGGSSSVNGTDAMGGTISMGNNATWNHGASCTVQQDIGSFGLWFTGLRFSYSNNAIDYKIKACRYYKKNNFPFENTSVKDFERNKTGVRDTTRNAKIENYSLLQEINVNLPKFILFAKTWYEHDTRETQMSMSANYYGGSQDKIHDQNLRAIGGIRYFQQTHRLTASAGYIHNYELYNGNKNEEIATHAITANAEYANAALLKGEVRAGIGFQHIIPKVYAYENGKKEERIDLTASYKTDALKIAELSICMREAFVSNFKSQFAPSIGFSSPVAKKEQFLCNISGNISRNYKVPTLNDRLWIPGGNPDLKAESGISYETGCNCTFHKGKYTLQTAANIYLMDVRNWIQWVNAGSYWETRNIKNVRNKGAELMACNKWEWAHAAIETHLNYAFCRATESKKTDKNNNAQIMYTPKHTANAHCSMQFKSWKCTISANYTGKRLTESGKTLSGYCLTDLTAGKSFRAGKNIFDLTAEINNIFGTAYQNQENYAMPERNYKISIKYKFN